MIISIGYIVKSKRGIEFRKWATKVLKDYLVKGVAVNEYISSLDLLDDFDHHRFVSPNTHKELKSL